MKIPGTENASQDDIDDAAELAAELGITLAEFLAMPCGLSDTDERAHEFSSLGGES